MDQPRPILSPDKIILNARPVDKAAAIRAAGQLLADGGHVQPAYINAMLARESMATTYLGNGVAVPHGTRDAMALVSSTGISILRVPDGVNFGDGNVAHLVVGLAAKGNEHLDVLASLAEVCSDDASLNRLLSAGSADEIMEILRAGLGS